MIFPLQFLYHFINIASIVTGCNRKAYLHRLQRHIQIIKEFDMKILLEAESQMYESKQIGLSS